MARRCRPIRVVQDEAVQARRCRGEVLLLSAFGTLPSTSPGIADAVTLSVPVKGNDEAATLQRLALELAEEHNVQAEIAVNRDHLVVRLTRRDYGEIQPIA